MNSKLKKTASLLATGGMLLSLAMPVLATEIVITDNGSGSDNYANVNQTTTTVVTQNNVANVTNEVDADAETGDNSASFNTGGEVGIMTGDAAVSVSVQNELNTNIADVDCCDASGTDVEISGNGAFSDNDVQLRQGSTNEVIQKNTANVTNDIEYVNAETGDNKAWANTGGDVGIKTGNAGVAVSVATIANTNVATVGGYLDDMYEPSASFVIKDNGAGSDNYINARLSKTNVLAQTNKANITNEVDADAETGDNWAKFNTGGEVGIMTGDAGVLVDIDNMVNFNYADVDCGCTWDVYLKIANNGADFMHECMMDTKCGEVMGEDDNTIRLRLNSLQAITSGNLANLDNIADHLKVDTGDNKAWSNGSGSDGDPGILTGNATSVVEIDNVGNVNSLDGGIFELPWDDIDPLFDLGFLFAFFGMMS